MSFLYALSDKYGPAFIGFLLAWALIGLVLFSDAVKMFLAIRKSKHTAERK